MFQGQGLRWVVLLSVMVAGARVFGDEQEMERLISPQLLKAGKLQSVWDTKLPMEKNERLEKMVIIGEQIYALSDRNFLACINRQTGSVLYSRTIAEAGMPFLGLELYKDKLFCVMGDKLVELNAELGTEVSSRRLGYVVLCPPARNSEYFYVSGEDKRIHTLRAADGVELLEVSAEDDSAIVTLLADEEFVIFGTDTGKVVRLAPGEPRRMWQFAAQEGIAGEIVPDGNSVYFASRDTNVYRLELKNGQLVWKYQMAAKLEKSPRVSGTVVYQPVAGKGVSAIEKSSGKLMWDFAGGAEVLTEADNKAYIITEDGELVVMNNKQAKVVYSVNFSAVERYAVNLQDSLIYVGDEEGRIACLKPIE
jgi:outer membrane protein assembly factor BamB